MQGDLSKRETEEVCLVRYQYLAAPGPSIRVGYTVAAKHTRDRSCVPLHGESSGCTRGSTHHGVTGREVSQLVMNMWSLGPEGMWGLGDDDFHYYQTCPVSFYYVA